MTHVSEKHHPFVYQRQGGVRTTVFWICSILVVSLLLAFAIGDTRRSRAGQTGVEVVSDARTKPVQQSPGGRLVTFAEAAAPLAAVPGELPPAKYSDAIRFEKGDETKDVILSPDAWSPMVVAPPEVDYRIDVSPPAGYRIRYIDGYEMDIGPEETAWYGDIRRAVFQLRGKVPGQTARVRIAPQVGGSG